MMRPQRMIVPVLVRHRFVLVDIEIDRTDGEEIVEIRGGLFGRRRLTERQMDALGVTGRRVEEACDAQLVRERRAANEARDNAQREGL